MAKAWLVHAGENFDLVASTQEIAINWLLEHGYARLDDEPLVETYNMETHEWEKWSMAKVAEYLVGGFIGKRNGKYVTMFAVHSLRIAEHKLTISSFVAK